MALSPLARCLPFLFDCVLAVLAHSRSPKLFRAQFVTEAFDFTVAPLAKILFAEEKLAGKLYRKTFFWVGSFIHKHSTPGTPASLCFAGFSRNHAIAHSFSIAYCARYSRGKRLKHVWRTKLCAGFSAPQILQRSVSFIKHRH
jgi:hypothetical protein